MRKIARVIVTVEYVSGAVRYRSFSRQGTIRALKARLRERFAGEQEVAHVAFGNGTYDFYYGGH